MSFIDDYLNDITDDYAIRARRARELRKFEEEAEAFKAPDTHLWIDADGINVTQMPMTIKEALIWFDDLLWQQGIETTDPVLTDMFMRLVVWPPAPSICISIPIKEGEGCYKIQVGTRQVPTYEWKCLREEEQRTGGGDTH